MSTGGTILFLVSAAFALGGAVATVSVRNPLRAAMALLVHILALAGLFLTLHAHLLAALQLLVYAGAIVVLFVFVVMLIGPAAELPHPLAESGKKGSGGTSTVLVKTLGAALTLVMTAAIASQLLLIQGEYVNIDPCVTGAECGQFGGVKALGQVIYQQAAVPFELISVLLTVAVVGAVAVARGRNKQELGALAEGQASQEEKVSTEAPARGHS